MPTRECIICHNIKTFDNFHRKQGNLDGIDHRCKSCKKILSKTEKYLLANRKASSNWRKNNYNRYRETENERRRNSPPNSNYRINMARYHKKYRETEIGRLNHNISNSKRRSKEKKIKHDFKIKELKYLIKSTNGICPNCQRLFEMGYGVTIDHIIPISKAPIDYTYTIKDIQPLCKSCNSIKGINYASKIM